MRTRVLRRDETLLWKYLDTPTTRTIIDIVNVLLLLLLLHPFNGLFSKTIWNSRYQKGKTSLDLNEARDYGVLGWQWHQLDHMHTICTSLRTDNHTNTSSLNFVHAGCSFWRKTCSTLFAIGQQRRSLWQLIVHQLVSMPNDVDCRPILFSIRTVSVYVCRRLCMA